MFEFMSQRGRGNAFLLAGLADGTALCGMDVHLRGRALGTEARCASVHADGYPDAPLALSDWLYT